MTWEIYLFGALLVGAALLLIAIPMWRHREESGAKVVLGVVVIAFPLVVALVYNQINSYDWDGQFSAANSSQKQPPVDGMIRELAIRLRENPDVEGWALLGRSYAQLGQYQQAADAFYEAWVMTEGKAPKISMDYAEALILVDQRSLVTSAGDLIDDVLKITPNDARALWYGGLSAASKGNQELAAARWSLLLRQELPDNMRMVVQQQLAALTGEEGALPAPGAEAITAITVTIDLAPELKERVEGNELMFLIARNLDQPMPPVAVKRVRVGEFPVTIEISDNNVMIPGKTLGGVKRLALIARVSKSGNAMQSPEDLYGEATPQTAADGSLTATVLIDQVVPGD